MGALGNSYLEPGGWQLSVAHRWLHSDRHFIGGVEQKQREQQGSQIINDVHTVDFTTTYGITPRFSLGLTLPFIYARRSGALDRANDHDITAAGLGDVRLATTVWVLDPVKHVDGNFAFGGGIKAPTGDYEARDIRYRSRTIGGIPTVVAEEGYVDRSIQPGDGGWGVLLEAQGFQKVFDKTFAYASATYLINPREKIPSTQNSVWDAYLLRIGLSYAIWPSKGLALSLGGRMEGVPSTDWFGGSSGGRRPGYSIGIEPGITWTHGKFSINVTAPVALENNRERNFAGTPGDAAFADYLIISSIAYRF
ncbi:MAG: hypothetical protein AAB676_13605 [Verrucomicrobiota bacterium]